MQMCLCCVAVSQYVRGNGDGGQPAAADIIYSASPPVTKGLCLVCHTEFNLALARVWQHSTNFLFTRTRPKVRPVHLQPGQRQRRSRCWPPERKVRLSLLLVDALTTRGGTVRPGRNPTPRGCKCSVPRSLLNRGSPVLTNGDFNLTL